MRRSLRSLALTLSIALSAVAMTAAPAMASPESTLLGMINATRSANGLAPLQVYWDLTDDAEAHSKVMKQTGDLHHNPNLAHVTSGWHALAENVGVGPELGRLHDAFMDSPGHRKNILGNYNYVGVGVVRASETKLWVTVIFMRGPDGLVDPPAEEPPAEEPPAEEPPAEEPPVVEPPPAPEPDPLPTPQPEPLPEPVSKPDPRPDPEPPVPAPAAEPVPDKLPEPLPAFSEKMGTVSPFLPISRLPMVDRLRSLATSLL